jgi:hypothetical protein
MIDIYESYMNLVDSITNQGNSILILGTVGFSIGVIFLIITFFSKNKTYPIIDRITIAFLIAVIGLIVGIFLTIVLYILPIAFILALLYLLSKLLNKSYESNR